MHAVGSALFRQSDPKQPLFVEVRWTHVEREFTVDKTKLTLDSLQLANLRRKLACAQHSNRGVSLRMQGLNQWAYSIINAVRPIAPNVPGFASKI